MKHASVDHAQLHRHLKQKKHLAFYLGLLFCVLVVAGEWFRRVPLPQSLAFWTVVPPLLFPSWVDYWNVWDAFLWTKTLSLIPIAVIWCSIVRLGMNERLTRLGTFVVLSFNIAEAVAKDLLSKEGRVTWNQLNGICGILLILSELPTLHTIRISDDATHDFLWTQGQPWIIAYTIWNLMFVYSNYPYSFGRHLVVLMAPLTLVCVNSSSGGWDTWLQARGYTLAFYFLIRCTLYDELRAMTDVSWWWRQGATARHHDMTTPPDEETRVLQVVSFTCVFILLFLNNVSSFYMKKGQCSWLDPNSTTTWVVSC